MRRTIAALAAAAVLALAGCSTAQPSAAPLAAPTKAAASSSPTPTTTTPAPASTPTVWTKAEAARQYLAIVKPANAAVDALNAALRKNRLRPLTAACRGYAAADDTFARALDRGMWAPNVRPIVDDLIAELAGSRNSLLGCAAGKSLDDALASLNQFPAQPSGAAQRLRVRLGLPGTA